MKEIAIKQRFYPTTEQAELLAQTFGCVRVVYNAILKWRTDAFYNEGQKVNYNAASARLTELKKLPEFAWLNDVSCVPLQQSLRHQQSAFKNFFDGRTKYPTFKKKRSNQSAEFTKSAFSYKDGKIFIAKSKQPLDIRWSRELPVTHRPSTSPRTAQAATLCPCSAVSSLNHCRLVKKQPVLIWV